MTSDSSILLTPSVTNLRAYALIYRGNFILVMLLAVSLSFFQPQDLSHRYIPHRVIFREHFSQPLSVFITDVD